ncbi:MAG: choice-of-anchor L domain-containing protein, partial [Chitinophagales bacterium]|nr:choice-of-anchor L domain-containing protein [Chitinophagales bacterium]
MKRILRYTIFLSLIALFGIRATAQCPNGKISIQIHTDNNGGDTGWEVVDIGTQAVINSISAGSLNNNTTYNWNICVSNGGCYWVRITDSNEDGICCSAGSGSFNVSYNNTLVESGGSFGSVETVIVGQCNLCDESTVFIEILTDNNAAETSWELRNTLTNGVEYTELAGALGNSTHYLWYACTGELTCYDFRIFDSGNNGFLTDGFYNIYEGGNTVAGSGSGNFGASSLVPGLGNCSNYANCGTDSLRIQIRTDFLPHETGWHVIDVTTNSVIAGVQPGDLYQPNTIHNWSVCIDPTHCYQVVFLDEGNNGLCCSWGNGYYRVYDKNGSLIQQGGSFESAETVGMWGSCSNPCTGQNTITVQIQPDDFGSETTWTIFNQITQQPVAMGGPYTDGNNNLIKTNICVPTGCYYFVISDVNSNGICCDYGIGYYIVSYNNTVAGSGSLFSKMGYVYGLGSGCASPVIVTDNDNYTPDELVEDILLGSCIDVSNIDYTGAPGAIGYFSNGGAMGLAQGILLTTGSTDIAVGPNNLGVASAIAGTPGDSELENAAGLPANITLDACALEFDFIPYNNSVTFRYVFGSEEYPEWVCSDYNDAFAFLVSGPGYGVNTNVALIPATALPVSINTVNSGNPGINAIPGGCGPTGLNYSAYYVNNTLGVNIQYDAYTTPFTATLNVTPCQTYHMKIVIADVVDDIWDSGLFVEASSFSGGPQITVTASADVREGCDGSFTFTTAETSSSPIVVNFTVSGIATEGTDYSNIPSFITIPANQSSYTLDIETILDAIHPESSESVIITLQNACACTPTTDQLLIINNPPITPDINGPTSVCPTGSVTLEGSASGTTGTPTYSWSPGGSTNDEITVNPNGTTTYTLVVTDDCGQTASTTHTVTEPDCDDNNDCTNDLCNAGVCSHTPITCNDGNACTTDGCAPATGCTTTPVVCNDGNACTTDGCA